MMADTTLFGRLQRLFSNNVIVRNVGGKKLKIADTDKVQHIAKSNLVDRFTKLYSGYGASATTDAVHKKSLRLGLFKDYESMDDDGIIGSALDIYADESTMKSEYGSVLEIQTENENIKAILHNLFYDILNIEFNLWPWVRNMCKYGDFFLHLEINEKYGITNVAPLSAYDVARVEGLDPENPHYVKFIIEQGTNESSAYTSSKPHQSELENFEVAHFRLLSDSNFLPYGKSMVEQARKTWKQLTLMEDAMMIHRIMRAPEKRVFQIDIGNIPPAEVDNYMQKILNKMKKTPIIDQATGEYNLKYNMQNITEDFFLPVRGGDSGTRIESLPGLTYEAIEDIDYLKNKMLAALRVPKAFIGYEESLGSKATLAAEDVRFARTIERIQRITISELTKIAIVHLYAQGYQDADLVDFELDLTNPSTIYETEKVELWNSKTQLASSMLQDGIVSTEWIYKNVFNFTDDKIKEMDNQIVFDYKQKFRRAQIESEGNDPAKSGEAQGTPSDNQAGRTGHELDDQGGSPPGGFEGAGRPKEGGKYGKDSGARGRDPLGAHDKKKQYNPGLALAHFDGLKKNMEKFSKKDYRLINEADTIENEYKEELKDVKTK
jgi:hypothetical protein